MKIYFEQELIDDNDKETEEWEDEKRQKQIEDNDKETKEWEDEKAENDKGKDED